MLETIAIILAVLIVVVVVLLGYAATKPNTFTYSRSRASTPRRKRSPRWSAISESGGWSP